MLIRYVHICMYMYVERMKKEIKKVSGYMIANGYSTLLDYCHYSILFIREIYIISLVS